MSIQKLFFFCYLLAFGGFTQQYILLKIVPIKNKYGL